MPVSVFEARVRSLQIRLVDERDRGQASGIPLDDWTEEFDNDIPQTGNTQTRAELVQHSHIRGAVGGADVSEATPGALLGQETAQEIEGPEELIDGRGDARGRVELGSS